MIRMGGHVRVYLGDKLLMEGTFIDMTNDPYVTNRGHMTHEKRIAMSLAKLNSSRPDRPDWGTRHVAAWREPQPNEAGVVGFVTAAAVYADNHRKRFESRIGDDGVLGEPWALILMSVLTLLNGDLGRLDGGTVDALVRHMLIEEGFDPNE